MTDLDFAHHIQQGITLFNENKPAAALPHLDIAVRLRPDVPEAHITRGNALQALGRLREAAESFVAAIRARPDYVEAYFNLGNALREDCRWELAETAFARAIELRPDYVEARVNLGDILYVQGRHGEATAHHRATVARFPQSADARFNLGLALLAAGDFAEGWAEYRYRLLRPDGATSLQNLHRPVWNGETLAGKRILVHPEQGLGDAIQFMRFAPRLNAMGAEVHLGAYRELHRLAGQLPGIAGVVGPGDPLPDVDLQCMLLCLPRLLRLNTAADFASAPYFNAPEADRARIGPRLRALPGRRIGIVWAGRPDHKRDADRSLRLADLTTLTHVPGTTLVSLQQGGAAAQAEEGLVRPVIIGPFTDMAETAAAVSELDLVITVDTSVAHLAGALGRPVWVLLPLAPDWRWGMSGDTTPWYPTMRLFRQRRLGDWAEVIERVVSALDAPTWN